MLLWIEDPRLALIGSVLHHTAYFKTVVLIQVKFEKVSREESKVEIM
jgi:hypothetical protein